MNTPIWNPRFHGNGFIQVYLDPCTRLHIWHPELPATRVANACIHDHRFWFESTVLMGELIHTDYGVYDFGSENHTLWQQGPGHSDNKAGALEQVSESCSVRVIDLKRFVAGETYEFGGPGNYHDTKGIGHTATLMRKTSVEKDYRARIVALGGEEPDHAFENQPNPNKMLAIVQSTFRLLTSYDNVETDYDCDF